MKNERREQKHQLTEEKLDEISARFEYTSSAMRFMRKHFYGGSPKEKCLYLAQVTHMIPTLTFFLNSYQ